jgi:hypothetical protein
LRLEYVAEMSSDVYDVQIYQNLLAYRRFLDVHRTAGVERGFAPAAGTGRLATGRGSAVADCTEDQMSIVDDLVSNLIERNVIKLSGAFTITLVEGGLALKGHVLSTVRDQKKNKDIVRVDAPVDAQVKVADIIIPLPEIH